MQRSPATVILVSSIIVLAWLGQAYSQPAPYSLGKNIGLSLSEQLASTAVNNPLSLNAPFIFGLSSGEDSPGQKQNMIFDISVGSIYVPDSASSGFGINCDSSTTCSKSGVPGPLPTYSGVPVTGTPASTLLRFSSGKLKDSQFPAPLPFQLATFNDLWKNQFGNNGLLGFGPSSALWDFVANTYSPTKGQDHFDFSFYLVARDLSKLADTGSVKFDGSQITVNGRYTSTEQVVSAALTTDSLNLGAWYFPKASIKGWYGQQDLTPPAGLCIDSMIHALVILPTLEAASLRAAVFNQLCGQNTGCTSDNSKISGVSPIEFNLPSSSGDMITVKVPATCFISFVNNQAVLAIADATSSYACKNSLVSAGRLLFAFTEITIRMQVNDQKQKTIYLGASKVYLPSKWFYFWLLMALIGLLLFIFGMIFVVRNYSPNKAYFDGSAQRNLDDPHRTLSD